MHKNKRGLSRYRTPLARSGTWVVEEIPGVGITKRQGGWQPVVLGTHPGLAEDATTRSQQINIASKLLLQSGMLHRLFGTRQQGLEAVCRSHRELNGNG